MNLDTAKIQPVRGTQDRLSEETLSLRHIEDIAFRTAEKYGYREIETPIFEFTDVFARTLGDTSDIVTKEMYTFKDLGGDSITLRPEGTAGIARAFISNGLNQSLPLKLFYKGPMFRYERPQKGRRRQFHQVGVEVLGVSDCLADVEVISLGHHFLAELGIESDTTIEINTLGDYESREHYKKELVEYLSQYEQSLSPESIKRIRKNPLRILESKDENDQKVLERAPLIKNSLNDYSKGFFDSVLEGLNNLNIKYTLNDKLVRGLDYYTHTAFEFTSKNLGAQNTILAGGRYDNLIEQMGGANTPGIGWAAGIERLELLTHKESSVVRPISVIPVNKTTMPVAFNLANQLRRKSFVIDLSYSGNLSKRMKKANKINSCASILLGEEEISNNVALIRDMDSGDQIQVTMGKIQDYLKKYKY